MALQQLSWVVGFSLHSFHSLSLISFFSPLFGTRTLLVMIPLSIFPTDWYGCRRPVSLSQAVRISKVCPDAHIKGTKHLLLSSKQTVLSTPAKLLSLVQQRAPLLIPEILSSPDRRCWFGQSPCTEVPLCLPWPHHLCLQRFFYACSVIASPPPGKKGSNIYFPSLLWLLGTQDPCSPGYLECWITNGKLLKGSSEGHTVERKTSGLMLSSHLGYRVRKDSGKQRKAQHLFLMLFFPQKQKKKNESIHWCIPV